MEKNKKEILERVLLLMKYDNKQTLSENLEKVQILEQPSPGTNSYKRAVQNLQGVEIPKPDITIKSSNQKSNNPGFAATSPDLWKLVNEGYENDVKSYACELSKMTFTELANLFTKMDVGSITPDLVRYGTGTPTVASVILENEMYARRQIAQSENKFETIFIPLKKILNPESDVFRKGKYQNYSTQAMINLVRDTSNNIGSTPQPPKTTLIPTAFIQGRGFLSSPSYYAAKSATLICETGVIPASGKPKEKTKTTTMDFSKIPDRKTMWEKITKKYQDKYPTLNAMNFQDVRKDGGLKDKYSIPPENSLRSLYSKNWEFPADLGTNIFDFAISAGYDQNQAKQILEKFGTKNEKGEIRYKSIIKKFDNEQQEKIYDDDLKKNEGDILKDELVLTVFPNASKIYNDESDENCKKQYLRFFQGIIDGSIKNKKGQILGQPYKEGGRLIYAKWDKPTPPCNDEWWDKNGWKIQLGTALVLAITLPGYGWGVALELLADTALNIYSLKKAVDSQDEDRIAFETLYVFLPIIMASPPVRQALSNLKYPPEAVESLKRKIAYITPDFTYAQRKYIIDELTDIEKRILTTMTNDPDILKAIKNVPTEYLDELSEQVKNASKLPNAVKQGVKLPMWKKTAEFFINLSVYGGPMLGYATLVDEAAKKKIGRPLNREEKMFWNATAKILKEKYQKKLFEGLSQLPVEKFSELATTENSQIRKIVEDIDRQENPIDEAKRIEEEQKKEVDRIWMRLFGGEELPSDAFEPITNSSVSTPTTVKKSDKESKIEDDNLPGAGQKNKNNVSPEVKPIEKKIDIEYPEVDAK